MRPVDAAAVAGAPDVQVATRRGGTAEGCPPDEQTSVAVGAGPGDGQGLLRAAEWKRGGRSEHFQVQWRRLVSYVLHVARRRDPRLRLWADQQIRPISELPLAAASGRSAGRHSREKLPHALRQALKLVSSLTQGERTDGIFSRRCDHPSDVIIPVN